jgi:hypothetical protein
MSHRRPASALAAAAVCLALLLGRRAEAAPETPCQESFARFVAAWCKGDAAAVVLCLAPEGSVRLKLLAPPAGSDKPIDGTMKRENAKKVLKEYFANLVLPKQALTDVTPKDKRDGPVRNFDYTYRARGEDTVTTRLSVLLRKDDAGTWRLASVEESTLPPP